MNTPESPTPTPSVGIAIDLLRVAARIDEKHTLCLGSEHADLLRSAASRLPPDRPKGGEDYVSFKVGDLIETPLLYHVAGVHLGAINQESIVELVPMDQTRPDAHGEVRHPMVPVHILVRGIQAGIFTHATL